MKYYRDLCIFNIVNQLIPDQSICHQIHPLSAISTTGKKVGGGGERAKIQKLPRCISIVGKIDLKKIISIKKIGEADGSRTSKIRFESQRLYRLRQTGIYYYLR